MASYDFDYAILLLRQAVDFAEVERDFVPLRKWVNEVEAAGYELEAVDDRLNFPAGQEVLAATLQSNASGLHSSEETGQRIRLWLHGGSL